MIIQCEQCSARYNLDPAKIPNRENRVRCSRCKCIFTIQPQRPSLLVAKESKDFHIHIQELLQNEPFDLLFAENGETSLKLIHARLPKLVVLDVSLPGIYGFELAELLKSDPLTKDIRIILLAAIHDKARYKRLPESLYGADDYIEAHHVEDKLITKIRALLPDFYQKSGEPPTQNEIHSPSVKSGEHEPYAGVERTKAERLARIILSDIALYNQEKVVQGIQEGNLEERLDKEFREGEEMIKQRFPDLPLNECGALLRKEMNNLMQQHKNVGSVS